MKKPQVYLFSLLFFFTAVWCIGIVAAPVLKNAGQNKIAEAIYSSFSHVCHQSSARSFQIEGEKFGVCIRCTAVYFAFLAGLLLFLFSRPLKRTDVPDRRLLFAAAFPMIIDVMLNDTGLLPSTAVSRIITGALFGGIMPWWIVPLFIEGCLQIIQKRKNQPQDSGVYNYAAKT